MFNRESNFPTTTTTPTTTARNSNINSTNQQNGLPRSPSTNMDEIPLPNVPQMNNNFDLEDILTRLSRLERESEKKSRVEERLSKIENAMDNFKSSVMKIINLIHFLNILKILCL